MPNTSEECVRVAWQALLRGDIGERDRLCCRAEALMEAQRTAYAVEKVLSVDFYVMRCGVVVPAKLMAKAARAIQ